MRSLKQLLCGLGGHDALLRFGAGRVSLVCTSCEYETPGWDLRPDPGVMAPTVEEEAAPTHMLTAALMLFALLAVVAPARAQVRSVTCTGSGTTLVCRASTAPPPIALTPAQQEALEVLTKSGAVSNLTFVRFGDTGPISARTGSVGPTAGPWDFPPERPARRLDGTLLSDPPTVYGAAPRHVRGGRR